MSMKKILIVDDDDELRENLSEILKAKGYHAESVSSGEEAMEKALAEEFDIVLLDLMMPKTGGMEVLAELRKKKPKTRVIMITAFATVDNAVEAIKKGASDYISKPFKIEELDTAIRRVLEEARFDKSVKALGLDYTLSSLSNSIRREIIRMLFTNRRMQLMEITRTLQIEDHTKVVFHLKTLKESGIIGQDKAKAYSLTKAGENAFNCLKILETHLSK